MERTAGHSKGHNEDSQKYDQGWNCANSGWPLLSRWVILESQWSIWCLQKPILELMILGPTAAFPFKVFLFLDCASSRGLKRSTLFLIQRWRNRFYYSKSICTPDTCRCPLLTWGIIPLLLYIRTSRDNYWAILLENEHCACGNKGNKQWRNFLNIAQIPFLLAC